MKKLELLKPGIPVVLSPQKKTAKDAILAAAIEKGAPVLQSDQIYGINQGLHSLDGQYFHFFPHKANTLNVLNPSQEFFLPLIGDHQLENARTAYVALQILKDNGILISEDQIGDGYRNIDWPGRMEIISRDPLIIVDGAHNRDSFRKFKNTIDAYLPNKKKLLIFGASEDKEVELMLGRIQSSLDELIITKAQHPRALEGEVIAVKAEKMNLKYHITDSVEDALATALRLADDQTVILAAGSIFIAGAVKNVWENQLLRNK